MPTDIIRHPIEPKKEKTWHLYMHPYFTKQASNVVREYIEHFSKKGDVVLDPFCGTGVTAIEALALRRKAIMLDLNPLATFITQQSIKQTNIKKFRKYFLELEEKVGKDIQKIDALSEKEIEKIDIPFWYPRGIKLPKNSDIEYVEELWTKKQLTGLSILWQAINDIADGETKEQMKLVFSATISRVNITYNLSHTRQKGEKIRLGDGGSAVFAQYRYWRPSQITELAVWERFEDRFKRILRGKEKWNDITHGFNVEENVEVITGSVLQLAEYLEGDSIDYIYTDPPYGGHIAYLDLSTMWNAWLGFSLTEQIRKDEIIEGGDLDKTQNEYESLLTKSIEEMSKVLKKGTWMSLVFAHKKLEFWNTIVDSGENNGLEFKGSTYQPTNNSSIHWKKNGANVLCSQRIASFRKTFKKSQRENTDDLYTYIINEIERACLDTDGASIDYIYNRVLDKLHNNNMIIEAKKKGYLKLNNILDDLSLFSFDSTSNLYYVKSREQEGDVYVKQYLERKGEFKTFLKGILKSSGSMTIDQIHKELFEIFKADKRFPIQKDLEGVLAEIAYKSKKSNKWILKTHEQAELDFTKVLDHKLVKIKPDGHSHSEVIYRLVQIGRYLGFLSWIGKREQTTNAFHNILFKELSIEKLPFTNLSKTQEEKIQQVDVIWFDKSQSPTYAFEIEESTSMVTGLDRFKYLLEANHDIANKLFIVTPKSRTRKLSQTFLKSTYVGAPLYMENKVHFIFKEDLIKFYDSHLDQEFSECDLKVLFNKVES